MKTKLKSDDWFKSYQVGAKMGKSTRPVYWGRTVITGHTVVGDMLEWALWASHTYMVSG